MRPSLKRRLRRVLISVIAAIRLIGGLKRQLTLKEKEIVKSIYDHSGGLNNLLRIREVLSEYGLNLADAELSSLLQLVFYREGFVLRLDQFMRIMTLLKQQHQASQDDQDDSCSAFVALGGNHDKSGSISADALRATVKSFDLCVDIDKLVEEVDEDGSGQIDYSEFAHMVDRGFNSAAELAAAARSGSVSGTGASSALYDSLARIGGVGGGSGGGGGGMGGGGDSAGLGKDTNEAVIGGWWKLNYRVVQQAPNRKNERSLSAVSLASEDGPDEDPKIQVEPAEPEILTVRPKHHKTGAAKRRTTNVSNLSAMGGEKRPSFMTSNFMASASMTNGGDGAGGVASAGAGGSGVGPNSAPGPGGKAAHRGGNARMQIHASPSAVERGRGGQPANGSGSFNTHRTSYANMPTKRNRVLSSLQAAGLQKRASPYDYYVEPFSPTAVVTEHITFADTATSDGVKPGGASHVLFPPPVWHHMAIPFQDKLARWTS